MLNNREEGKIQHIMQAELILFVEKYVQLLLKFMFSRIVDQPKLIHRLSGNSIILVLIYI